MLIVSDTHLPRRARDLPDQVWREVDRADTVIHAGHWCGPDGFEPLSARARHLVGVYGNNDGPGLRARLPEVARATLGGVRFVVVHETGDGRGREGRCERRFPDCDVLAFEHSHIPWDTASPSGLRLLDPGSPTDRRSRPHHTYMTAVAEEGRLRDVELHRVE